MTPTCLVLQLSKTQCPSPPGMSPGLSVFLTPLVIYQVPWAINPQPLTPLLGPEDLNPIGLKIQ